MKITPEYISSLINFYSNSIKPEWSYNPNDKDMRNLQVKGAARVYNLLEEYKLALLADEVGMGKTIQALAVCAALWNEKPDAKVLILAPRDEIAKNWEKEYQTFIRHHYRYNDNIVKSISSQQPVKKMIYCQNLYSLVQEVQQGWGQLFIGKISSFSSLMAGKKVINRLQKLEIKNLTKAKRLSENAKAGTEFNNEIIRLLKNEMMEYADGNKPLFDLIIIDEAHYFRHKDSDSLRVNTAKELFGNPSAEMYIPLSKKVLLLTATPNHSSSNDIKNIVSYFTKRFESENNNYKDILDKICVRRLRRLSTKGLNKYNYRKEIPTPSDFKGNPLSEMFFGLYQHELAKELNKNKGEKQGGKGISRMMKYLEGVEFIPFEKPQTTVEDTEEENEKEAKRNSADYKIGSDTKILLDISKKFKEIFDEYPKHPKYDKLVDDLTVKNNGAKAVVFVRRIPSVREIAKRIILFYDKRMWESLKKKNTGLDLLSYENLDRNNFRKFIVDRESDKIKIEDGEVEEEDVNIPSSKVLNLFKVVKSDKSTDASNFRLRFVHSRPNIFAMFFSPGEDYFAKEYEDLLSYRFEVGNEPLENYYNSSLIHRTDKIGKKSISKDIISTLLSKNPIEKSGEIRKLKIPTLLTIFWEVFNADNSITPKQKEAVVNTYKSFSYYEKESFSNFLEKGTLLASEALVWFYEIFRMIRQEDDKPLALYFTFAEVVKKDIKLSKLYTQIQDSILHFKSIYTKVFSINGDKNLLQESWDSFNNAQPIYPYNAENKNQKVLRCFNTPFFPDILVATSVLQEGVNLQYFCNTIYHYGMAWTPGDNERRIGRIDRMFGKIERMLEEDQDSILPIYYPYLKDTIDEEHMGRFIKRKFKEESLIDKGKAYQETADFAIEENENDNWQNFLRNPDKKEINDPFPADSYHFNGLYTPEIKKNNYSLNKFYNSIVNSIKLLQRYNPQFYFISQNDSQKLLIDPVLNGNRKQPVVIELAIDNIGTGYFKESVFCLKMVTPLCSVTQLKKLKGNFHWNKKIQQSYLPGIKLCMDSTQTGGSTWGIYMSYELPLFLKDFKNNPLSIEEIQIAFKNLITCADLTEQEIFNKDLTMDELNLPAYSIKLDSPEKFRNAEQRRFEHEWKTNGEYLILEGESDSNNKFDIEKQSLIDNHENFYVKSYYCNGRWIHQVANHSIDTQKDKLNLLEKHLSVMLASKRWKD